MSYSLPQLLVECGKDPDPTSLAHISLGLVLPLLGERAPLQHRPLGWHVQRTAAALAAGQVGLRFDRFGQLCGFVQWASVAPEVSDRLLAAGTEALEPHEMRGGGETWILEFFTGHGELPQVLACLRDDWLAQAQRVTYFRIKRGRRIAKRVSRNDPLSFLHHRASQPATAGAPFLRSAEAQGLRHGASTVLDAARALGAVALLAQDAPAFATLPLPLALGRLRHPLNGLQHRLYRRADGSLCGFLSWAWLTDDMLELGVPVPHQLASFQWNEGRRLVLCDAFCTADGLLPMVRDLAQGLFKGEPIWLPAPSPARCAPAPLQLHPEMLEFVSSLGTPSPCAVLDLVESLRLRGEVPA